MTDREMITIAARAMGIEGEWADGDFGSSWESGIEILSPVAHIWNPLRNAQDRWEMMKKLKIDVCWHLKVAEIGDNISIYWPFDEPDPEHAVVRAAAESVR